MVPPPCRLHPISIPSARGVAFMAAIALGEAVRGVDVGAGTGGFAGLLGLVGLPRFLVLPCRESDREERVNEWNKIPSSTDFCERRW